MNPVYPMKCHIRAEAGVTRVDVYDDIGSGNWFSEGVSAKNFAAQLSDVQGPLDVHINSGGGDVADGIAIGNAIRSHKGFKRTIVDGMAASIASVIMQAGDERIVEPGAMVMIHDAFSSCVGNAAEMRKLADDLDKHSDNLAGIYATRAGGTAEQWRDTMKATTWYTADEAVAAGLADKVGAGAATLPDGFDLAAFQTVPGRIAAQLRTLPRAEAPAEPVPVPVPAEPAPAAEPPAPAPEPPGAVPEPPVEAAPAGKSGDDIHAGLPAWLNDDTAPVPAWLLSAEEANA